MTNDGSRFAPAFYNVEDRVELSLYFRIRLDIKSIEYLNYSLVIIH